MREVGIVTRGYTAVIPFRHDGTATAIRGSRDIGLS